MNDKQAFRQHLVREVSSLLTGAEAIVAVEFTERMLAVLTADRDKWRDRCERLIGHYGDADHWGCTIRNCKQCDAEIEGCKQDGFCRGDNGYDFARAIQKEIDDDTTRTS